MRHQNSVFHQIQQHIPWALFDRLVKEHKADHRVRRLNTKSQFLALLFGQLAGATSLREIEAGLESQKARLYHVGGRPIARATLADANARRPAALFGELFAHMAKAACRKTRRHMRDALRILDATRINVSAICDWADMVGGKRAIKLHFNYDPATNVPLEMSLTGQKTNDIVVAKRLAVEPHASYVFDMGYYDFGWWAELDASGARFVTRLKSHTKLSVTHERKVPEGGSILSDRIGLLPRRMKRSRRNPFSDPVREIVVRISTDRIIRLLTNDLDAEAEEIAELYKERWQIELFFKWIKQNMEIRHFLGRSENAVRIQIYVALIAYLLLRAAQATQTAVQQPLAFACLVRLNLMHLKDIAAIRKPPSKPPSHDHRQLTLFNALC